MATRKSAKRKAVSHARDVFINCPYDQKFARIFHAITFTIHDAGFRARSALESNDTGTVRLQKIAKIIRESPYSIHDISRTETKGKAKMPRFNMPFECGLVFGAKYFGGTNHRSKALLVLDSIPYRYQQTMSDIAGQDTGCHNGDALSAIECVRRFLQSNGAALPGANKIKKRFLKFESKLGEIAKGGGFTKRELLDFDYWPDLVNAMVEFQTADPL